MENNVFLKEMGQRARKLRKSKKITLEQMSEQIQLDRTAIMYFEHGKRNTRILTIKAIADCLGVTAMDLIQGV